MRLPNMTVSRNHIVLLVFILLMIIKPSFSQEIFIAGHAENRPNELVRVIVYNDQLSKVKKALVATYTDQNGNFEIAVNLQETTFAYLAVGLKKGEFYLKPGSTYQFDIPYDTSSIRGSVFDELPLQFNVTADDGDLIENIGKFNQMYNTFVINNTNRIYRSRDKSLVTNFRSDVQKEFDEADDKYLNDYIKYTLASLEWISKIKSEDEIIKEYFVGQEVLYQNIQYTEFFNDFFKAAIGSTQLFDYTDLIEAANSERGYISVERLLKRSEALANDAEIRELVALIILAKKYYSPDIKKRKVIGIFMELQRNSKFLGVQEVAENLITKLTHHAYGTAATPFKLLDAMEVPTELSHFKGKFILLNFNRSGCNMCTHYFQNLEEIRKEFGGKLQVVSIVKEDGFEELTVYAEERSYEWPILDLGKNILLLEDYNIRTFPAFVIINPDNTIAMETAPLPGEGLNLYIRRFMSEYDKRQAGGKGN